MAQPVKYERNHQFSQDEPGYQDGAALDTELDNASESINQIRHNLAMIQNDDGSLNTGAFGSMAEDAREMLPHMDEIHRVGQDLLTTESGSLDLGLVTDPPDTASTVIGGYIKKVAENMPAVIVVAQFIENATIADNTEY